MEALSFNQTRMMEDGKLSILETSSNSGATMGDSLPPSSPSGGGMRPSFMKVDGNTGLFCNTKSEFDYTVVKCLDSVFDETTTGTLEEEEEKLKTFLRLRPFSKNPVVGEGKTRAKAKENQKRGIEIKNETTVIAYPQHNHLLSFRGGGPDRRKGTEFKFTKVFDQDAEQSVVFEECVLPLIDKFLKGENCLIFSYGATNSGKTYTLQGNSADYGIIPRALDCIFSRLQDKIYRALDIRPYLYQNFHQINPRERETILAKKEKLLKESAKIKKEQIRFNSNISFGSSHSNGSNTSIFCGVSPLDMMNYALYANTMLYSIWVSYAELYNERVYDLLETVYVGANKRRKELKLLQDRNGFVYIKDLTEIQVFTDEETYRIYLAGRKNLQFAATQMNANSSRSHSFFTLRVVTIGVGLGLLPYPKSVHRITFCDLAGMERVYQTENEGLRLKESGTINSSLTVLLKVIRILREKQRTGNMMLETIPFRESKLTHIFKSFFTSSTHIRMIVNVNPDPSCAESTVQVLLNSAIASTVIAFRPMDPVEPILKTESKSEKENDKTRQTQSKNKVHFKSFTASSDEENGSSSRSSTTSSIPDPPSVIPKNKALQVRVAELERENSELKGLITELKGLNSELNSKNAQLSYEKELIRERSVKLLAEQNRLWSQRYADAQRIQECLSNRRVSIVARLTKQKQQNSPGSKCGRNYAPPVLDLEQLEEEEVDDDCDKENKPPKL